MIRKVVVIIPKLWTSVTVHRAFRKISSSTPSPPESKIAHFNDMFLIQKYNLSGLKWWLLPTGWRYIGSESPLVFFFNETCFQAAWLPPHNVPSEQNGPFSFSFPSLRVLDSIYFNYIFNHKNEEMMRLTLNLKLGWCKQCIWFVPESLPVKRLTANILCIWFP